MVDLAFVTTVYNGQAFLAQALASLSGQTHDDIEICVVLDGSTDGSEEIARFAAEADARIHVVPMPRIGRSGALNVGIDRTQAPIVAILDADDLAAPWRAQLTLGLFAEAPERVPLVSGALVNIEGDQEVADWGAPEVGSVRDVTKLLRRGNPISHSSAAFRRTDLTRVGGYDARRVRQVDYDLYVRLARDGHELRRTNQVFGAAREHPNRTFQGQARASYVAGSIRVQSRAIRELPGDKSDAIFLGLRALGAGIPAKYRARWNPARG